MATKPIEIIDNSSFFCQENIRHKVLYGGQRVAVDGKYSKGFNCIGNEAKVIIYRQ